MSHPVPIAVLAGARPNFMKVAPLLRAMRNEPVFRPLLIHTGQHYDESMSGQFFRELSIPDPDHHLGAGSGTHAEQTAHVMLRLEPVLVLEKPAALVVVGDVNSTVAGALVASKLGIPVVHAEAGLRSFDRTMPEEINRIVTDSISDLLLVTEESGRTNLLQEGHAPDQIEFVGNLMIDSLHAHLQSALQSPIGTELGIPPGATFGLVTLHRPANVDNEHQFRSILEALRTISADLPLYWPMHPRTHSRLESSRLEVGDRIHLVQPLGYFDFLFMQAKAALILTDSGGVQEESTALGVPCLTVRDNTERPVTIHCGTNRLAGTSTDSILRAWAATRGEALSAAMPPLWDGRAGERSCAAIRRFLRLDSPHPTACSDD